MLSAPNDASSAPRQFIDQNGQSSKSGGTLLLGVQAGFLCFRLLFVVLVQAVMPALLCVASSGLLGSGCCCCPFGGAAGLLRSVSGCCCCCRLVLLVPLAAAVSACYTPIAANSYLSVVFAPNFAEEEYMSRVPYASAVGSLMYAWFALGRILHMQSALLVGLWLIWSMTGYVFTLGDSVVSWKATLQPTVTLSTTEIE
uniref:Uncharacterized protein n=1 Tax=Chenopodium quinoa TaxID=63459 RepID=A0A803L7H0_CHEQI